MTEELRLSVSKSKTFIQCKKQFEFNYILKLPQKERDYLTLGKFCHRVLEWFHQQYIEGCLLPYNVTMSDAFKIGLVDYKDSMTPVIKKECWDIINNYLKLISKDKKIGFSVTSVEKKFNFELEPNLILNGFIDRIQIDDDNVTHVADYKTTKNKKYLKNDWFQLLTYALVLMTEDPSLEKVRGSYILLRHDFEYFTKEFDRKQVLEVKSKIIDYANQIRNEKDFLPNPTALCNYCSFQEHCPEGLEKSYTKKTYGEVSW